LRVYKKEKILKLLSKFIKENLTRPFILLAVAILLSGVAITPAQAHVIDRIEIKRVGDEAEIQILFDVRIQYLREASLNNNDIHVFLKLLEADPDGARLVPEAMDSPPSDISPHFTVSFPELDSSLAIHFDEKVAYRIQPGKDGRSISIFIPPVSLKSEPQVDAGMAPAISPLIVEQDAKQLLENAREALSHDQVVTAIEALNRLLNLPPNSQSQAAQKLIGEAREKNGEFDKARVEYEIYLKFYPDAKDAAQVKARLALLPQAGTKPILRLGQKKTNDMQMMFYGGLSQNYYKGMSHTDTTTADINGVSTESLTTTDQSMLVSALDLTGRKRTEMTDTRIVVRDVYDANFLPGQRSTNRLNSAYIEQSARDRSYLYRLGRQTSSAGGVSGRFDGVWLGYTPNSTWRINGVIGTPVEFYNSVTEKKTFAGMSIDLTRLPEQWSGSGYFIHQKVAGIVDRQALGVETHYFDTQRNYSGLLEYDTLFKAVNIATLQGNWNTEAGSNYNVLLDHRKAPSLQITNALQGLATQSITSQMQSGASADTLRADAQALTATSNLFLVGMTRPYSEHWRWGGDFRIANTSGTGAMPGTGNSYTYTMQAIANNLFIDNDLSVISASYVDDPSFKGRSLLFNRVETLRQNWRLDMSLQLYSENDIWGNNTRRITPSLKLNYHWSDSVSLEGEGGIENTHTYSATQNDNTRRKYFYVGYRWDFR
jgi:tetratricopeptide (TPR) repeat protein